MSSIDIPLFKLNPPLPPAAPVLRARLAQRMAAAAGVRLVLLSAPPGFGKTTVMNQLREQLQAQGVDTAWLTLDASDNDATRFLASLGAAWRQIDVDASASFASEPLAELASRAGRFALFLDDFESIHEASVLALVRSLIERLPRSGVVIIGSRSLPDLGLSRLRAQGQLLEFDADSLRFSLDEADSYFTLRGQRLPQDVLGKLLQKTEGWIAALWLVSLALERAGREGAAFVERFSGSNRAIAEYLADNVLAHQPPEVRDFLLRTSILRQVNADVAKALLPRADVEAILKRLDAQSLFLVSDGDEGSYRYHRLFSDFLQSRLLRELPDEVPRLHLAACGWYEDQGRPVPAIEHAIEGGDYPHALSLIEGQALRFLHEGRLRLLARWFQAIPVELVRANPQIHAASVWALLFTQGPGGAAVELDHAREAAKVDPVAAAHVNAQAPLYLAMLDRYEEALAVGVESLARLPTRSEFADSVLRDAMANVFSVMGDRRRAQDLIDEARRAPGAFNQMYAESVEGLLDVQGGRLREATARFRVALTATGPSSHNFTGGNAWAGVLYAGTLYESNELNMAEQLVNVYLPLACDVGLPGHMIGGHMIRTRIAFARGDVARAFETLTALEYLGHHRHLPRLVVSAKIERARLLLLQGNAQASREELDRADDPQLWGRIRRLWLPANDTDFLTMARIRWDLHFGDPRAALTLIDQELAEATELNRQRRVMKLKALKAVAQQRTGDPSAAAETIATVLRQACGEGFIRLFADEGPVLGRLVQHFHGLLLEMPARRSDPVLLDYLQRLVAAFGSLPPGDGPSPAAAEGLMEPLTRKELQVLQLAAEGYSNAAMAEKLGLSDSTVRTHLRNISTKLSARSRAEAVAIARRLGVIR